MTLGYVAIYWALPITAGCGFIIVLSQFGLTRCLQSCAAALWAAAIAYDEAKRLWGFEYRKVMQSAIREY